jgi:hypothetical protein
VSNRRQPQDQVAVALALAAQAGELFDGGGLQPNMAFAVGVDLGLDITEPSGSVAQIAR